MCATEKIFAASDVWNIPPHNAVLDIDVQYGGKFRTKGPVWWTELKYLSFSRMR
jgi:hypothetical protein